MLISERYQLYTQHIALNQNIHSISSLHLQTATMNNQQQLTAPARLRELLSDSSHTIVAPGVYDGISARVALAQGFECLYMVR